MHRWLHEDVNEPGDENLACYACGVAVDATEATIDDALLFLPACKPGNDERAHHFQFVGPVGGSDMLNDAYLDCAYGDARIGWTTEGATVSPCIGA